jgi:hypothetical protein
MSDEITVYVANMSEDVWPFISTISDKKTFEFEIEDNSHLGDRDIFAVSPNGGILCILPRNVTGDYMTYYQTIMNIHTARVVVPPNHTGEICEDILRSEDIMGELVRAAGATRSLTLISYTTSLQFLRLAEALRVRGIAVHTPEAPQEEDAWVVNFYGSKSGIRQFAQKSGAVEPDLRMPDGLVCVGIDDAARIAANKYIARDGVVIKTNKGHSGSGVLIFRPGQLPEEYRPCREKIREILSRDVYWDRFPIVIEDYIAANSAIGGGFPNVEFRVQKSGRVEFLYYCGMRVTPEGSFRGVEINHSVVSDKIEAQMVDTGFFVGEQYAKAGYRGYYDVDFVAGRGGELFVTESNVRRTGGTHVYAVANRLFGKEFMYETYTLSCNTYPLAKGKIFTFPSLLDALKPVLFDKKTREGVVLVSENMLEMGQMQYIVFGQNKKRAEEIEAEMEHLLV